jgi:hypothetical protein
MTTDLLQLQNVEDAITAKFLSPKDYDQYLKESDLIHALISMIKKVSGFIRK